MLEMQASLLLNDHYQSACITRKHWSTPLHHALRQQKLFTVPPLTELCHTALQTTRHRQEVVLGCHGHAAHTPDEDSFSNQRDINPDSTSRSSSSLAKLCQSAHILAADFEPLYHKKKERYIFSEMHSVVDTNRYLFVYDDHVGWGLIQLHQAILCKIQFFNIFHYL